MKFRGKKISKAQQRIDSLGGKKHNKISKPLARLTKERKKREDTNYYYRNEMENHQRPCGDQKGNKGGNTINTNTLHKIEQFLKNTNYHK